MQKKVYHLMGGLLAWKGKVLPNYPKVQVFDKDQNLEQLLTTAMDLEKGAWRFYQHARDKFSQEPIRPILDQVSIAEKAHASLVYRFWKRFKHNPPTFDRFYSSLKGDILEGGQNFEDTCRQLEAIQYRGCQGIIDLAMTIEYSAFELYRVMAEITDDPNARETFITIAQAEKAHMRALTNAIRLCPEEQTN